MKSLAIDWLGIIACRIKMGINLVSGQSSTLTPKWLYELHDKLPLDINRETSPHAIDLLHQCHIRMSECFEQSNDAALYVSFI